QLPQPRPAGDRPSGGRGGPARRRDDRDRPRTRHAARRVRDLDAAAPATLPDRTAARRRPGAEGPAPPRGAAAQRQQHLTLRRAETHMAYRLGIDVGGTFTDLLLHDSGSGRTWVAKTPSTPSDQSVGVLEGVRLIGEMADIGADDLDAILHG